jgi:hypothetical protein
MWVDLRWAPVATITILLGSADAVLLGRHSIDGDEGACDGSVAYVFMSHRGLPMEDVWRTYFDDCPKNSYTAVLHSQQMVHPEMLPEASLVPDPVMGNPRFKYSMVEIMLKLYREAYNSKTPNGCRPRWVQTLSDSCAPIRGCRENHEFLASHAGTSFVGSGDVWAFDTPLGSRRRPQQWAETFWYKASQWTTLWMDHAKLMLDHEAENYPIWFNTYCPDEHYIPNVLTKLGANVTRKSLTQTHFSQGLEKLVDNEHPETISCEASDGTPHLVDQPPVGSSEFPSASMTLMAVHRRGNLSYSILLEEAYAHGRRFARKFNPNCASYLISNLLHPESTALLLARNGRNRSAHIEEHTRLRREAREKAAEDAEERKDLLRQLAENRNDEASEHERVRKEAMQERGQMKLQMELDAIVAPMQHREKLKELRALQEESRHAEALEHESVRREAREERERLQRELDAISTPEDTPGQ